MFNIGRSTTGVYHTVAGDSSACNGRSFAGYFATSLDAISEAPEEMFCKKCFSPNARDKSRKENAIYCYNNL